MKSNLSPYEQVIRLTDTCLGPDTAEHIAKLIRVHLQKTPEELTKAELTSLIDWITVAVTFIVSDETKIRRYLSRLSAYAQSQ